MRIVNFLLAAMFLVFAFVQVNDPDPIMWILIYGCMAVLCVLAIFNFYPRKVLIGVLILFVAYSTVFFSGVMVWLKSENKSALFDDVAKMENLYIEESREFLGLFICIIVLTVFIIRSAKK